MLPGPGNDGGSGVGLRGRKKDVVSGPTTTFVVEGYHLSRGKTRESVLVVGLPTTLVGRSEQGL